MFMAKMKYQIIYNDLKKRIENYEYKRGDMLPSETSITNEYSCSRNTVRRAISMLEDTGYVQSTQGKGVTVIFEERDKTAFYFNYIETFSEAMDRINKKGHTKVILLGNIDCTKSLSLRTGFKIGTPLTYIQRLHFIDDSPVIINNSYFRADIIPNITEKIAIDSFYKYIESVLRITIVNSKRWLTVEPITAVDEKYLGINNINALAVISSQTFDSNGTMIEFTESRHNPTNFRFEYIAKRR